MNISRDDSVNSLLNSYLDLIFDVLHAASSNRYVDDNDIRLVYLGPIASFSIFKLTTSSVKHLEDISQTQLDLLMYKLKTSAEKCS